MIILITNPFAGLHKQREREWGSVSGVRRGAGEALAPEHTPRGGRYTLPRLWKPTKNS